MGQFFSEIKFNLGKKKKGKKNFVRKENGRLCGTEVGGWAHNERSILIGQFWLVVGLFRLIR